MTGRGDNPEVLIVHDEPTELRLLLAELENQGFHCVAASDSTGAAALLLGDTEGRIRSAVIDRVLGGPMDGIELMEAIRGVRPTLDTILLTAYGGVDIGLKALKKGAYRYFMAPYNYDEIAIAIRYLQERSDTIAHQTGALNCTPEQLTWLQSCIDGVPDEVILLDASYNIILANQAKCKKFGESLVGRRCHEALERQTERCATCVTHGAFQGHAVGPVWHEYTGPDGSPRVAEITAGPVHGLNGRIVAVIEITRDATSRNRLDDITVELERATSLGSVQTIVTTGLLNLGADRVRLYINSEREKKLVGVIADGVVDRELIMGRFESGGFTVDVSDSGPKAPRITLQNKKPVLYRYNPDASDWQVRDEGPKFVCDTPEIPYAEELAKHDVREWLELPLVVGNEIIGMISLDRKKTRQPFTDLDYQILSAYSAISAQALENAMHRQHTDALQKLEAQITPQTSLEDVLTNIVQAGCDVLPESFGHVRLMNEKADGLEMRAGVGNYWGVARKTLPLGEGVSGRVAQTCQEMIVDDVVQAAQAGQTELPRAGADTKGCFACLPITYGNRVLGTLNLSSRRRYALVRRLGFVRELVRISASAIYTSELLRKLRSQVHHLGRLHEEARFVQASRDLGKTIFAVLTGLTYKGGLEFNRALLFVVESQTLVCKLALGPLDQTEAGRIYDDPLWNSRTPTSLKMLGELYEKDPDKYSQSPIMSLANSLHVRVGDAGQILSKVLANKTTVRMRTADLGHDDKLRLLEGGEFATTPLLIGSESTGVVYVDNKFTGNAISQDAIDLLELFASHTAVAIHNATESERIESAHRQAYDRMAVDTAHSLGNVLSPIEAKIEVLKETLGVANLEQVNALGKLCQDAVELVKRIKKCTLEIEPELERVELADLIQSVLDEHRQRAACPFDQGDRSWFVDCDRTLLGESFRELFQNAENVGAKLREILLRPASAPGLPKVEVIVRDEGPGVAEAYKERIFEPLFKIRGNGTGLGLYRARRVIEAHGGTIRETGIEGRGAEFRVVLPVAVAGLNATEVVAS